MSHAQNSTLILSVLRFLLRPALSFCLRYGVKLPEILECVKESLVSLAEESIVASGHKITSSRLGVMTGIQRREVNRLIESPPRGDRHTGLTAKIIGQWQNDKQFSVRGAPRPLTYGFEDSEFHSLVRLISKDMNPATVLFDLERIGAIAKKDRLLHLNVPVYVPIGDVKAGFALLEKDSSDLIQAIEENIFENPEISNLHVRTEYDRVKESALPEIRRWLLSNGHEFHRRARDYISQFDQDVNPDPEFKGKTAHVVVSSFGRGIANNRKC